MTGLTLKTLGTTNVCLHFGRTRDEIVGSVDYDFVGHIDKRRSLTEYIFIVGGCAISRKATLHTTIALSILRLSTGLFHRLVRKLFYQKDYLVNLVITCRLPQFFVIVRMLFSSQKIICFISRTKHIDV